MPSPSNAQRANAQRVGPDSNVVYLNRRATDRVVKIWQDATDKEAIRENIDSALWDNCFLLALDELIDCSVIIDHGQKVGCGLRLPKQKIHNFKNLPSSLREKIFTLGHACVQSRSPRHHAEELSDSEEIPVKRYRLALVPLLSAKERLDESTYPTSTVLGVFTYQ
jgi:hypothetical protein